MKNKKRILSITSVTLITLVACNKGNTSTIISSNESNSLIESISEEVSLSSLSSEQESSNIVSSESSITDDSSSILSNTSKSESSSSVSSSSPEASSSSVTISSIEPEKEKIGYVKGPLKYKISDFTDSYTPNEGEANILIVPIDLTSCGDANKYTLDKWSDSKINFIKTQYFGTGNVGAKVSSYYDYRYWTFKDYFEQASFGKVTISGEVASVYKAKSTDYISKINVEYSQEFKDLLNDALMFIQDNDKETDWSLYDRNNDGYFDACHFITNYANASWSEQLWPHQDEMAMPLLDNYKVVNNYSCSSIEHFSSAITAIHEQGHMFGLQDYYDYSEEGYNFLGEYDMQVANCFDWNSYSRLTTGWANPTVITGDLDSVTVTLGDAASTGECLLVPANYETFNNSPYDEYFLFELFSPKGNNELSWQLYGSGLGNYGVRAYHVLGDLVGDYDTDNPFYYLNPDVDLLEHGKSFKVSNAACNSATAEDYGYSMDEYDNYPLLSLISRKSGAKYLRTNSSRLSKEDLWTKGDTFTWTKARNSLIKGGSYANTMINGEVFPYEITFDAMSKDSMTVTVKKVK